MDLTPIDFPGTKPPKDWDDGIGECQNLPVMVRDGISVSCWRAGWRDRFKFLWRGKVVLHIAGRQPPVMLVVE